MSAVNDWLTASHPALAAFASLPLQERLFVKARFWTAPLLAVAQQASGERVLDVGCGHGVLSALVASGAPKRSVLGIDPDPRKISWAKQSVGQLPNVRVEVANVEDIAQREPSGFDTVVVVDVLYLLSALARESFLNACRRALVPGGWLVLKEVEDDGSWKARKALLQEWVMVKALKRTHQSGGLGLESRESMAQALGKAGFEISEVVSLSSTFTTPHILFVAQSR